MPDALVFFVAATVVLLFAAWAGWNVGGRRSGKPSILPDRVWLCDACKSFNDPTHATCYRCHRPRPTDAREIVPDAEFKVDQQLGRSKTSVAWGASSPWLAAEEPLRDAWLTERARPSETALAESKPEPAFWKDPTAGPPDADAPDSDAADADAPGPAAATRGDPDDAPLASSVDHPLDGVEEPGTSR
jgi:hypothetical protein